jgi:hypothetical protein
VVFNGQCTMLTSDSPTAKKAPSTKEKATK